MGLQLSLIGSQTVVHLLLLLQLLAELRLTNAQLSAPKRARAEELNASERRREQGDGGASAVTYFFSRLCFSRLISATRCSRLSQRSRVSLNLDFMLFT